MTIRLVTSWITLFQYAKAVGTARKSGNSEQLAKAEARLKAYEQWCLEADRMLHFPGERS